MIAFDVADRKSFENLNHWLADVDKHSSENISKLVLANKSDITDKREVSDVDIEKFKQETGLEVIEVSAKTGENVEDAFHVITKRCVDSRTSNPDSGAFGMREKARRSAAGMKNGVQRLSTYLKKKQ